MTSNRGNSWFYFTMLSCEIGLKPELPRCAHGHLRSEFSIRRKVTSNPAVGRTLIGSDEGKNLK